MWYGWFHSGKWRVLSWLLKWPAAWNKAPQKYCVCLIPRAQHYLNEEVNCTEPSPLFSIPCFSTTSTTPPSTPSTRWTRPASPPKSFTTERRRKPKSPRRHKPTAKTTQNKTTATSTKTSKSKSTLTTFDFSAARPRAWWCRRNPTPSTITLTSTRDSWARRRRYRRRCCGPRSPRLKLCTARRCRRDIPIDDGSRQTTARVKTRAGPNRPKTRLKNITGLSSDQP